MAAATKHETPQQTWSESIRDARRERIIEAAAQVFADAGLDGASVRQIAAAAGCTTGAIYPLFRNKEAIYAELLMRSLRTLRQRLVAVTAEGATPEARIRLGAYCLLEYYLERPSEFAISFYLSAGLKRKGLGDELNAKLNREMASVNAFEHKDMAFFVGTENADAAATSLFSHITGLLVMQLRGRFTVFAGDPHTLLENYLRLLLERAHAN